MPFTIPNEASATYVDQAEPESGDIAIITAGFDQTGVVSGCAVTAQSTPDMTVAVASGSVIVAGSTVAVTSGNLTIGAADGTNPRFDLITVNGSGTKAVTAGTAAANPVFPALPASSAVLASIYVPAAGGGATITTTKIVDKRLLVRPYPGGSSGGIFLTQSAGGTIGTSTITVSQSIPTGLASRGVLIVVDAYTTNAEARYVSSITGSQFTVNSAWRLGHSGSNILVVHDLTVTPAMYGAVANGTTDDWRPVQRAILDCSIAGAKLSGGNRLFAKYAVKQTVYLPETNFDHLYLVAPNNFAYDCTTNAEHCVMMSARQVDGFTANATTNEITASQSLATLGLTIDKEIAFSNPYGETLFSAAGTPILSGRIYFVKALTGANTFTIASTFQGAVLDITAAGTGGMLFTNMGSDIGCRGNILRIDNQKSNLNVLRLTTEQDASIDTIYIDSQGVGPPVADGTYCFKFYNGQWLNIRNMAIVPGGSMVAVSLTGSGVNISDTLTINGPASTGILVQGTHHIIAGYLMEGVGGGSGGCIRIEGAARNIKFGPGYWSPPSDEDIPLFDDNSAGTSSYEFDDVFTTLLDNAFISDSRCGNLRTRLGSSSSPVGSIRDGGLGDDNLTVSGMHFTSSASAGPVIKRRYSMRTRRADQQTVTAAPEIEFYHLDPTTGAQTITLVGYGDNSTYTVKNGGSANNVSVVSGSPIEGGTSYTTLTPGQCKTYCYSQGTWYVIGAF